MAQLVYSVFADQNRARLRQIFRRTFINTMRQLWPNRRHAVFTDQMMNKKTIHNTAAAAIIPWSLAMCLTVDIVWCANLAGAIFPRFGSVVTYRTVN